MPTIHSTAILEGDVNLADDVAIGPHCVITGPVTLGRGTKLIGSAYLHGPLTMGENNVVYPFCCLGFAPQHLKFDPATPGAGLQIGSNNIFREHVNIHRAFQPEHPTRIGDRNFFMETSHAGHDCVISNDVTVVAGARLGGHVEVQDKVIVGGNSSIHQFCRIGRGAMIGWVYRMLYREGLPIGAAKERIAERAGDPIIDEYLRFFEGGKRTICPGIGTTTRGSHEKETVEQE